MFISVLRNKLNDTSISRKLYFTIGFTALLVTIELCTLWFSITTLSAVRSYVGGEGLWSKAQKDAVLHLRDYAYLHKEKDYQAFQDFLSVPYGDKAARIELQKPNPDYAKARQYLLQGRNHPDDISGMITLLRRFSQVYYLNKAFTAWASAEPALDELVEIGKKLHGMVEAKSDPEEIAVLMLEIERINADLTKLEDNFSYTLGEGARWLENLVLKLVLTLSLTIGVISIVIAVSINRNLKKGVDAIIGGAENLRNGDLTARVPVYSKDEIGTLATAFNEMTETLAGKIEELKATEDVMRREKERAERLEKAKHDFLINISHEMRTPMNAILGFAQHLEGSVEDPEQLDSIRMILESGDHLLITLNDILDFSKIETGEVNFEKIPFSIKGIIASVVKLKKSSALLKNLELNYNQLDIIPSIVYGDGNKFTKIILSLISNAIKFTEKGHISITAKVLTESNDKVRIEFIVADTGIGIHEAQQQKIFDPFEQASNEMTRKFGGTGIGLSLVKRLIDLQGGEITVNSSLGNGAEFRFSLPFYKELSADTDKENVVTSSTCGHGVRVLVVEDNVINQLLVLKLLKKCGYESTVAENGRVALEKLEHETFDIILMDLQMPEMDGYEASMQIRNLSSAKRDIPIIAMTAHTIKGDRQKCMDIGINEYISKPYNSSELYEKMHRLIKC